MSKGRKPQICKGPTTVLTIRERPGVTTVVDVVPDKPHCWEFNLINTTTAITDTTVGDAVFGLVQNSQIAVTALTGLLGFVPDNVTQEIREAIQRLNFSDLQGIVIAKEDVTTVVVKLCLR